MDKTETIVQLKKLLASKKAADLLKALKKLQRNYFPEFGNTVVDIFEERYKRNISWESKGFFFENKKSRKRHTIAHK